VPKFKHKTFVQLAEFCIKKQKKHQHIDTYLCSFDLSDNSHYALNLQNIVHQGYKKSCLIHAESRLAKNHSVKKLLVVRTRRNNPELLMAKPCMLCQTFLKNKKIEEVVYSIDEKTYGIYYPQKNQFKTKTFK